MDVKDYHKVCEEVYDTEPSTSKEDTVNSLQNIALEEMNNISKGNEVEINELKMEVETLEAVDQTQAESKVIQEVIEPSIDDKCDVNTKDIFGPTEDKETVIETSFSIVNSNVSSEPTTSQDNTPSSSNDIESSGSPSNDQNKIKRSISKGQVNGDSGISMEKSGNSSDEDSSKRQKLNETVSSKSKSDDENVDNVPKFHKLKSKVKKRNYRSKRPPAGENADSCNEGSTEDVEMRQETEESTTSRGAENRERGLETNSDGPDVEDADGNDSNEWTTASEEELEEAEEDIPACLKKEKPKPNWFVVPEIIHREMGNNPLFQRRYYGSLHVVERLELAYKLEEHQGCVNALNFNQRGNLLASGSDDLAVVIWDWAKGKKHHSFDSGHRSNMFQAKWLPFHVEYLMATCARDGQVRLLDVRRGTSRRIAMHHAPTHKLAVHPDAPHVIISVGEDAKVLSIDIREEKPTKLLAVKDGSSDVQLYSVHSNPLNSNEFCVGGRSQVVRIYDRRKVSAPLHKLCPDHLAGNKHAHVTCAVYNYNGTEVLASYNDEDIYLFDTVMPQTGDFAHRYQGHRNNATVKGVNFFGPKSEFVISGSDCGYIFIWDKNTEAIVNWMPGDEQGVVNCLEPHPHIPILATSGLDFDVKIWVPSCEHPPNLTKLASCVKSNAINRAEDTANESDAFDGQMLWILLRTIRHAERIRNHSARRGSSDRNRNVADDDDEDDNVDDSSDDNDSSDHSDSQSEGDGIRTLQCPPS
ncbi:DDB1- and CUL4-associated factor 8-like [Osmia bicornis bicornis]|uniref:DDB1- and CUL4-associated factor 8-like n=1 Tax=Osmia bicornis bicornis TaxID=1437191 RepID=UPI001EAE9E3C|nr:DDB1- and CUL4-associated factor 8-like [Osmia bicornis bicornis]